MFFGVIFFNFLPQNKITPCWERTSVMLNMFPIIIPVRQCIYFCVGCIVESRVGGGGGGGGGGGLS